MTNVNADTVRQYFRSTPAAFSALDEAAQATVAEQHDGKVRGRIHPEAREAFNKANKRKGLSYVEGEGPGNTVTVQGVKVNAKGAVRRPNVEFDATEARETLPALGFEVGARGALPKAGLEALGAAIWV